MQFFDNEVNLLSVPEAGVEELIDNEELRSTIPEKHMVEWSKGMENALRAQAAGLDESV